MTSSISLSCVNCAISVRIDSQIAFTMPDLGYPPRMGNWVICYEERQPLLLKWSFHFLRCTRIRRRASESIYKPLIVDTVSFLLWSTLKFHTIYLSDFGVPYHRRRWDVVLHGETPIAAEVFDYLH